MFEGMFWKQMNTLIWEFRLELWPAIRRSRMKSNEQLLDTNISAEITEHLRIKLLATWVWNIKKPLNAVSMPAPGFGSLLRDCGPSRRYENAMLKCAWQPEAA